MCGFKIGIAHSIPIPLLMNPNAIPTQIYTIPTPNPIPLHMNPNPESNPDSDSDSSFDSDSGFGIAPGLVPVQLAIDAFLEDTGTPKFRGRPRCTLPTTLDEDLRRIGRQLRNSDDIDALRTLDRRTWKNLAWEPA